MHLDRRSLLTGAIALALAPVAALAQVPAGYPASYADTIAAAVKEGKLLVYSATDAATAAPLVKDFEALYPGVKVEYHDMNTTEIYNRAISEKAAGGTSGDFIWSSAMDLQVKLVNDGYALAYASPEVPKLPAWAVWKNEAYGTTYEPISIIYNKRLLGADQVPQTHADLVRVLGQHGDKLKSKVTSYDVEKSGVGFLLITQDSKANPAFWDFVKALGTSSTRFQSSSGTMMERIGSGEALIGYNIIGSYAMARAKKDASIGYLFPKDYTLVMSRVGFISKTAAHPNAAKLWLDYLLSRRGQTLIGNQVELGSIRADVEGELTAAGLAKTLGAALRPIPVGPELMTYLDPTKRLAFLKQWQGAIKGGM
ncbi:ABC transporter substrate-binding protein [Piscinibacter sp.]|jgi:iron(III) transport system substrate-binding protein|uniref:ABC transporter substrate-binding protein n=1 Tax=Piscinibacter sp. TaxID=1903157 RepID=UPI002F428E2B